MVFCYQAKLYVPVQLLYKFLRYLEIDHAI